MIRKIKVVCGIMLVCFCLSVFISCSSYKTEEEILEAFDKGKISEKKFEELMDDLEARERAARPAITSEEDEMHGPLYDEYKDYIK